MTAAPTEQIYKDAFISQAQALKTSPMAEADKIAMCAQKGENALAEAFYHGKITNTI